MGVSFGLISSRLDVVLSSLRSPRLSGLGGAENHANLVHDSFDDVAEITNRADGFYDTLGPSGRFFADLATSPFFPFFTPPSQLQCIGKAPYEKQTRSDPAIRELQFCPHG